MIITIRNRFPFDNDDERIKLIKLERKSPEREGERRS